jgi:hypothetical protein
VAVAAVAPEEVAEQRLRAHRALLVLQERRRRLQVRPAHQVFQVLRRLRQARPLVLRRLPLERQPRRVRQRLRLRVVVVAAEVLRVRRVDRRLRPAHRRQTKTVSSSTCGRVRTARAIGVR